MDILPDLAGEKSYAGVKCSRLELVPSEYAHVFPDVIQDKMTGDITLAGDQEWGNFFGQEDSFHFVEDIVDPNGTAMYRSRMSGVVSKDTIERIAILDRLFRNGHIIRFTDRNGRIKIMGKPKNGLYLRYTRDNKQQYGETNQVEVYWEFVNQRPVPEYAAS